MQLPVGGPKRENSPCWNRNTLTGPPFVSRQLSISYIFKESANIFSAETAICSLCR